MSCLILNVDLPAGATIQDACKDAIALATITGVKVRFEFNDKILFVLPNNNVDLLVMAYKESIVNKSVFVCSLEKTY